MPENGKHRLDQDLDTLFAAYRVACPDPEPGERFMPGVWQRIEANRAFSYRLRRLAQAIITAAAVASLAMGFYLSRPPQSLHSTYLELLAAGQQQDNIADTEIVQTAYGNKR